MRICLRRFCVELFAPVGEALPELFAQARRLAPLEPRAMVIPTIRRPFRALLVQPLRREAAR